MHSSETNCALDLQQRARENTYSKAQPLFFYLLLLFIFKEME